MALTNKSYTFKKENEKIYNIDSYNITNKASIMISNNGNVMLNNTNSNTNTDNFYGDGRLGLTDIRSTINVNPACFYFEELIQDHEIYGPVLWNAWYSLGTININDELIIYKKHAKSEEYVDECGDWAIVTVKEIVNDDDGTHYILYNTPDGTYSNNTANSATLVLQYKNLEIFDDIDFIQLYNEYVVVSVPHWDDYVVSPPKGILFIKSTDTVTLGNNARIGNQMGNIGAYGYRYDGTLHQYYFGGSKLGTGRYRADDYAEEEYRDTRSASIFSVYNDVRTPGMPGIDGMGIEEDSTASNRDAVSDDLNGKIYVGIGGTIPYNERYNRPYHMKGGSGGGIVIIQTPKILFKNAQSQIIANSGLEASTLELDNLGTGGSILLKTEEIEFLEQGLVASGNAASEYRDVRDSNFSTTRIYDDGKVIHYGLPGHMQFECSKYIIEGTEYTKDEFLDVYQDYIYDLYFNEHFELNDLKNDMSDYPSMVEKFEDYTYMSPIYETGSFFKIGTTGLLNIKIDDWYDIVEVISEFELFDDTQIKLVFSNDLGDNWYYFDFSNDGEVTSTSLSDSDLDTKANTIQEMKDFNNELLLTAAMVSPQRSNESKQIDITFAFKTDVSYKTPILKFLHVLYNRIPIPLAPIPIEPYDGEEFDNEYVDFVWLQPEQKYGSIQNRLQISTTPNFDDAIQPFSEDVMLPYEADEYVNETSAIKDIKPPVLFDRTLKSTSYTDSISASIEVTDKVIYHGDEYLINGVNVKTLQNELELPDVLDYRESYNRNTDKTITGWIQFQQDLEVGDSDEAGMFELTEIKSEELFSSYYGILKRVGRGSQYSFTVNSGESLLLEENDFTISYRFRIYEDFDKERRLFSLDTSGTKKIKCNIRGMYKDLSIDHNHRIDSPYVYGLYVNGVYVDATLMSKGNENVIVITYNSETGRLLTYINGVFVIDSAYVAEDSTEDGDTLVLFGDGSSANVDAIEFCVYDEVLENEDIQNISKIPMKDIRYNLETQQIEYKDLMYTDHLSGEHPILDIEHNGKSWGFTDTRSDLIKFFRCNLNSRLYSSTEKSIKLGTLLNNELITHTQVSEDNFIAGYKVYPDLYYSYLNQYRLKDNNTYFIDKNSLYDRGYHLPYKVNYYNTNLSATFKVKDYLDNWRFGIAFQNDVDKVGRTSPAAVYYIENDVDNKKMTFYMYDYTTANKRYNIIVKDLPFLLLENNIYSLKGYLEGENFRFTLQSDTDYNYLNEYEICTQDEGLYTRKSNATVTEDIYDTAMENGGEFLASRMYDYRYLGRGYEPISVVTYLDTEQDKKVGYKSFTYRYLTIAGVNIQKINRIYTRYSTLSPSASIKYFFKIGDTWKIYDFGDSEWKETDENNFDNAMSYDDVLKLSEYEFKRLGGPEYGSDFTVKFILETEDKIYTPEILDFWIEYNGPDTIDSWISDESNYTGLTFYYSKDWQVYEEPDFTNDAQGWEEMGTEMPDTSVFVEGHGSKPSQGTLKYFGGVRVLLKPKGKYYWRVAAYNGM